MYIFIVSGDLIFNTQKGSKTKLVVCTHSSHYKIKWKCLNKYPRSITSYSIYKLESNRTTSCNVLAKKPCLNRKLYFTKTFSNLDESMRKIYRMTELQSVLNKSTSLPNYQPTYLSLLKIWTLDIKVKFLHRARANMNRILKKMFHCLFLAPTF